jgi:hypothetical protein
VTRQAEECRTFEVDGEAVSIFGAQPLTDDDVSAFTQVVRAAKAHAAAQDPRPCNSPRCDSHETHTHGADCGPRCLCGQGMPAA